MEPDYSKLDKKVSFIITDTIKSVHSSRIYKKTPRQGEKFWVVKCTENTVRIFQKEFTDQKFIEILENKTIIGKKVLFGCQTFWNHVVKAEILKNE